MNVGAVWVCAVWTPSRRSTYYDRAETPIDDTSIWSVTCKASPGNFRISSSVIEREFGSPRASAVESVLPRWSRLAAPEPSDEALRSERFEHAFGWPWVALAYEGTRVTAQNGRSVREEVTWGIVLYRPTFGAGDRPFRALPLRPTWSGFLANTVFYAASMWLLWFLKVLRPFTLIRRWRIKRGRCPSCGYPMGASGICTECGTALPSRDAS